MDTLAIPKAQNYVGVGGGSGLSKQGQFHFQLVRARCRRMQAGAVVCKRICR